MVKLIQKMLIANDGEQYTDDRINNNNIANYFKANKDTILDLAEKHYEYLVEVFTKNAIDIAAASSSSSSHNPTSSLSQ